MRMGIFKATRGLGVLVAICLCLAAAAAQTGPPKPKVPPGKDPGGLAVAVIGAGVDYRRPEIAALLARDGEGEIIAWDVIDDDARPLDAAPVAGRRVPPHAGTAMAQRLKVEAPASRLIPIRVPDANPLALGGALAFITQTPARIAVLLTGADHRPEARSWAVFKDSALRARHLLIIAAAGNQGRDSDGHALAPQSLGLDNLISVTAADPAGRIADGASWGAVNVDIAVSLAAGDVPPADTPERAAALENAAAMRLAALAARLWAREPGLDGPTLKARLLALAKPFPGTADKRIRSGWLDPAAPTLSPQ